MSSLFGLSQYRYIFLVKSSYWISAASLIMIPTSHRGPAIVILPMVLRKALSLRGLPFAKSSTTRVMKSETSSHTMGQGTWKHGISSGA
jgi:hypothetical protein